MPSIISAVTWSSSMMFFLPILASVLPLSARAFAAPTKVDVVDLQAQHHRLNPIEELKVMQEACLTLGISDFDVYGDFEKDPSSSYLRQFEKEVANDFGKEDAVFMPSGVMAQNIALLIHSKKEHIVSEGCEEENSDFRFACHHSSHLLLWEESSFSKLGGFRAVEIDTRSTSDGIHIPAMNRRDVESVFLEEEKKYGVGIPLAETGLSSLIIELPHRELGGKLTPWEDVVAIGELCKRNGVKYHCDGARIFEASAGYGKELSELAKPFDSFYISFYKGLGAISGAMLMGEKGFCQEARVWLTRFGGNLYTKMPYAVSCWNGYRRHASKLEPTPAMTFLEKLAKLQRITQRIGLETCFSKVGEFTPLVPETNMVHVYLKKPVECCEKVRDQVRDELGLNIFSRLRSISSNDTRYSAGFRCYFEWTLGDANGTINDDCFILAWKEFASRINEEL